MIPLALIALALVAIAARSGSSSSSDTAAATTTGTPVVRKSNLVSFTVVGNRVKETPSAISAVVNSKLGRRVPLQIVALATMIASEAAAQSEKIQVGYAAINESKRLGIPLFVLLAKAGSFGTQLLNGYASTSRPPSKEDVLLAEKIFAGKVKDTSKGATHFDSPKAQRAAVARKAPGYRKSPEQVAAARKAAGMTLVYNTDSLRLWKAA